MLAAAGERWQLKVRAKAAARGGGAGGAFPALPPASWQMQRSPRGVGHPACFPCSRSPASAEELNK